ncbi:dihydrolipoamide acetyltransferase family protein [Nakamurella deserti]|uniref:dihydrolipoamide acetyltransferase family protein n=1 Tax=Nakamurella deserti TaxID=2164074 RepID=UPI000DBE065F|nr:dihydrolipoamide acetyltransferase family protein [Nakamurella deserti]
MSHVETFALPDVGEGLTEAEILDWRVAPGDEVGVNQILVEIETAKAAVELPSPYAGRVTSLLVTPGQTVDVGVPIITIDTDPGSDPATPVAAVATGPAGAAAAGPGDDEAGTKIGEMTADGRIATLVGFVSAGAASGRRPRRTPAAAPVPGTAPVNGAAASAQVGPAAVAPAAPAASSSAPAVPPAPAPARPAPAPARPAPVATDPHPAPAAPAVAGAPTRGVPLAAPPVRLLARELGVDLHTVTGSGPGGVITRDDVRQAAAPVTPAPATAAPPRSGIDTSRQTRVPIRGVRKATAAAMVGSAFTAPQVTVFQSIDVTELMALRQRLRDRREFADVKLTPLVFAARAVCLALRRAPDLNAHWDEAAQEIVFSDYVNLGIAADTPRGLVVPHIRDADALDLHGLALALADLVETARAGRTSPAAMSGGTFTITNIGVFGIDAGTPILNPGEAGILAMGAVKAAPWVVDGELAVRQVCQLSLTFDHRLVDGAQGARFLSDVGALLTDPGLALAW